MRNIIEAASFSQSAVARHFGISSQRFNQYLTGKREPIRYLSQVNFIGKSGYNNMFDFAIPKSKNSEQRIIKIINTLTKDKAINFAFSWLDTKEVRPEPAKALAFVNDNSIVSEDAINALKNYEIKPILWSKIDNYTSILTA